MIAFPALFRHSFSHGVHPEEHKSRTAGLPSTYWLLPGVTG